MVTTNSILLYGAEVWASAMEVKNYRIQITVEQGRGALRIACSYRTVSGETTMVIAGVIPVYLIIVERKWIYESRLASDRTTIAMDESERATIITGERERTKRKWQERLNEYKRAKWTKTLIREVAPWVDRKWGRLTFTSLTALDGLIGVGIWS